ncbi:MAG: S8 family serine peptidase [Deltaproteobacteria bacterium]|nr:S8 family serine peptidase [Deltaproteobacteria bacterium]
MLVLVLASSGSGSAAALCGDADGDDAVSVSDGVRLLRAAAGLEGCAAACDLDADGEVTVTDAVLVLRRAAELPIGAACGGGTIAGRLLLPPVVETTRAEHEPNDGPGTADVAGWIAPGDVRRLTGEIGADDPFDGWTFLAAGGLELDLDLSFSDGADVDLDLLLDAGRGGSATCERALPGREHCRVAVGSEEPASFDLVVAPATGSRPSSYALDVRAVRARADVPGVTALRAAGAPIEIEPDVYRGDTAPIVTGEVVIQLAPEPAGTAAGAAATARVLALADGAAIGEPMRPSLAAPDGTVRVTLPTLRARAAARGRGAATARAAKRERAAARARTRAAAAALAAEPGVLVAEPDRLARAARVPRDPLYPRQWHYPAIGLPRAWDVTIGSAGTVVAVVDTGIRSDHPDLAGRLVPGFDFISNPERANDGDGLDPDPFDPGDRPDHSDGGTFHGTHVAGTIAAATDGTRGVAGATWRTSIMPLRVLGIGGGSLFDVAQAVRFAAGLPNASGAVPPVPARVINLSLTTSNDDPVLRDAVDAATAAGALVVAAAGNTGREGALAPASYPNVLSIAATDRLGAPARYSSFGAGVDLAAPGGDTRRDRDADGFVDGILSTRLPGIEDYGLLQGTSMASAHLSGVAALLLGVPGGASAERLRDILLATADDRGAPGRDDHYGAGIVDAARAVRALAGLPPPADPVLALAAPAVRIAADESVLRVPLTNQGGGAIALAPPGVATDDGGRWLGAAIEDTTLRLEIDRDALPGGTYTGRVALASNGGADSLAVLAEVEGAPPADVGPVTVLLRDAATRAIVATTTATVADAYRYRFDRLAPGRYEILATTDRDGDGALCDLGESCGAYPGRNAPDVVAITDGRIAGARDFALQLVVGTAENAP